MADQDQTLRRIDYKSVFPFVHLFRGFRLAIDPSKLVLALAAILLLGLGGWLMDAIWPDHSRAMQGEISRHEAHQGGDFHAERKRAAEGRIERVNSGLILAGKEATGKVGHLENAYEDARDKRLNEIEEAYDKLPGDQKTDAAKAERDRQVERTHLEYAAALKRVESFRGEGLFVHLLDYEARQLDTIAASVLNLDFPGAVLALQRFLFVGPRWAITQHYFYFTFFFAFFLLLTAIAGGAISRISAVQVARDEKISIRQALRFSTGKVLSFVFAPLIPILIIFVIALVLGLLASPMGWFSYIGLDGVWSVVVGALLVVALLAGLVMALTALGLVGGGHLMYPTIAVEGTDSFDAVSRSFSYLYTRPWQLLWYSLVALVYGAVTYLFVRLFLYVLLVLTRFGVGMFVYGQARDGNDVFNTLWPAPGGVWDMSYSLDSSVLGPVQSLGAGLIWVWVSLTLALIGAYAVSLYFSSSTIIYYLMRKEVDATSIDDVYLEPSDEDFADAGVEPTPVTAPAGVAPADPVTDTPPAVEPPATLPPQPPADQSPTA